MKFLKVILFVYFSYLTVESACWETLNPGDKIAIVASSKKPLLGAITTAENLITTHGYTPVVYYNQSAPAAEYECSDTLENRTNCFLQALRSDVKAIWAIRGGRGANDIFINPEIFDEFKEVTPKLLIGFSDFTALHLWANSIGWPSLHGVVLSFCKENQHIVNAETSIQPYFNILSGRIREQTYNLIPENIFAQTAAFEGSCIIGGNLSLIQRSIGTSTAPDANGRILFIEDTGEEGSKLKEILVHIRRTSLLKNIKAIIWGHFSGDQADIDIAKTKFKEYMTQKSVPFYSANYFGHGPLNYPLPFCTPARIEAGGKLTVKTNNA